MVKEIFLNGERVEYILNIKKVKRLNVRIKQDGTVNVSASPNYTLLQIEGFLQNNATFILNAIKKYKAKPKFNYNSGDKMFVYGKEKTLCILEGQNFVKVQNDNVILSVKTLQDLPLRKKGIDAFYKHKTQAVLQMYFNDIYLLFKQKYNIAYPKLQIKKLTAAWGNCRKAKCEIHFSIYLAKLDVACIKYVIVHELAHLLQDNHSPKFYKIVQEFLPNYKQLKQKIKKYN